MSFYTVYAKTEIRTLTFKLLSSDELVLRIVMKQTLTGTRVKTEVNYISLTAVLFIGGIVTVVMTVTNPRPWDTSTCVTLQLICTACYRVAAKTQITQRNNNVFQNNTR